MTVKGTTTRLTDALEIADIASRLPELASRTTIAVTTRYPTLVFRISRAGGDRLEDIGYQPFNVGWLRGESACSRPRCRRGARKPTSKGFVDLLALDAGRRRRGGLTPSRCHRCRRWIRRAQAQSRPVDKDSYRLGRVAGGSGPEAASRARMITLHDARMPPAETRGACLQRPPVASPRGVRRSGLVAMPAATADGRSLHAAARGRETLLRSSARSPPSAAHARRLAVPLEPRDC
jgi:hypothetical protein